LTVASCTVKAAGVVTSTTVTRVLCRWKAAQDATRTRFRPTGRPSNTKRPSPSVRVERRLSSIVTCAPASGLRSAEHTTPSMRPVRGADAESRVSSASNVNATLVVLRLLT
jgi:hypothetical protein